MAHVGVSKNQGPWYTAKIIGFSLEEDPRNGPPIYGNSHIPQAVLLMVEASLSNLVWRECLLLKEARAN